MADAALSCRASCGGDGWTDVLAMDVHAIVEFEWAILLGLVLALALWELWRTRREIRRAREKDRR